MGIDGFRTTLRTCAFVLAVLAQPVAAQLADESAEDVKVPRRPASLFERLASDFELDGSVAFEFAHEGNFDLDASTADDIWSVEPTLNFSVEYTPTEDVAMFLETKLQRRVLIDAPSGSRSPKTVLEVEEFWAEFEDIAGDLSLKIGRQDFDDQREWLYDEELDAVVLVYDHDNVNINASVSRLRLIDKDLLSKDRTQRTNNYFLVGNYALSDDLDVGAYLLFRDDREDPDEDLFLLGLRSYGALSPAVSHWGELALARGQDGRRDIRGYAFDVGLTYTWNMPYRPSATVGWAFGSGGDGGDVDRNFRQTDLQDNNGRFAGVTNFKFYGEVLEPELSNLHVFTAGLGFRPTAKSSVDLVYHFYRQATAFDELRDSNLEEDPDGEHRNLGHGLDLVIGYREFDDISLEFTIGGFFPGQAFPDDADPAIYSAFDVNYSF